ncbi:GspH/FimT family pseudopilin [Indioceanicola profundi]|uniref:GspH/FimT family pseudopilin n=1 Tax=Indioceanicola profundi TaxID=2220096 RepID=UPI000E6AE265|nr:GspH/FimT family pseudopilin [Indioceanicola profundi]
MNRPGFSLLEALVTVSILGLTAMAIPNMKGWVEAAQRQMTTRAIVSGLTLARQTATAQRQPVEVFFDLHGRTWWTEPALAKGELPGGPLDVLGICAPGRPALIRFDADGGSSGGRLTLGEGDGASRIAIDFVTGRVDVE